MRKLLTLLSITMFVGAVAMAAVVDTPHDFSSLSTAGAYDDATAVQTCVFCHTPHQAASALAQDPLWNHVLSTTNFTDVYSSSTMNVTPTALGAAAAPNATVDHLCLSCHDGTVAVRSMYNPPNEGTSGAGPAITGTANVGTNLADDHPINFSYTTSIANGDLELNPIANPTVAQLLINGEVHCASCHDPHASSTLFMPFAGALDQSALCLRCHIK